MLRMKANGTAHNRSVYASPPIGGSGYTAGTLYNIAAKLVGKHMEEKIIEEWLIG
jgi:hypothetical protein